MFKPDIERVQEILEDRWVAHGFTKLTEPADADSEVYCAFQLNEECTTSENFRFLFLEPALMALERGVRDEEGGEYFRVRAYYNTEDVIVVTSSRGLLPETVGA